MIGIVKDNKANNYNIIIGSLCSALTMFNASCASSCKRLATYALILLVAMVCISKCVNTGCNRQSLSLRSIPGGGEGCHMKWTGMLVGKSELPENI